MEKGDTQVCLVQGPPGTGKTRTVIGVISCLLSLSKRNYETAKEAQQRPQESNTSTFSVHDNSRSKRPPKKSRLMLCAPSNGGVDELLLRMLKDKIVDDNGQLIKPRIVRLGKPLEGTSQRIVDITLDNLVETEVMKDEMWKIFIKSTQDFNNSQTALKNLERGFHEGDKATTKSELMVALRKHRTAKINAESRINLRRVEIKKQILENADIVAATLSSSGQYILLDHILQNDIRFDTVIIDEAGQATEPAALIPLRYGCKRLVLVGDARQLPAYVCSKEAQKAGLGLSLFERFERAGHEVVMLTVQYRMHPFIRTFPSRAFYGNKLRDAMRITTEVEKHNQDLAGTDWAGSIIESVDAARSNTDSVIKRNVTCAIVRPHHPQYLNPVMFFDLLSTEVKWNKSYQNPKESTFVLSFLEIFAPCLSNMSIAIISPYKSQVNLFKREMGSKPLFSRKSTGNSSNDGATQLSLNVEVNTVDGFQGREKDIVFLSTVRTSHVGFLEDSRRLNVAITRAKKCLIIVGHEGTLKKDKLWGEMISDLKSRKCIFTAPLSGKFSEYSGYSDLKVGIAAVMKGEKPSALTSTSNTSMSSVDKESAHHVIDNIVASSTPAVHAANPAALSSDLEEGEVEEEMSSFEGTSRKPSAKPRNSGSDGLPSLDSALSSKRRQTQDSFRQQDVIVVKKRRHS